LIISILPHCLPSLCVIKTGVKDYLRKILAEEWLFEVDEEALVQVNKLLGVRDS